MTIAHAINRDNGLFVREKPIDGNLDQSVAALLALRVLQGYFSRGKRGLHVFVWLLDAQILNGLISVFPVIRKERVDDLPRPGIDFVARARNTTIARRGRGREWSADKLLVAH